MNTYRIGLVLVFVGSSFQLQSMRVKRKASGSSSERPLKKTTLVRQNSAPRMMARSISRNPAVEAFTKALVTGDSATVKARIGMLPFSLYRQYLMLCLIPHGNKELVDFMLATIFNIWLDAIKKEPCDSIRKILVGIKRIKQSCGEELDHGFKATMENLRRCALSLKRVQRNTKLCKLAKQLPHFKTDENCLQMQVAYYLAQLDDENVPEHLVPLVAKARKLCSQAFPITGEMQ